MKDILFVTLELGKINTLIIGKTTSKAKQIYQKILILLLSDNTSTYRLQAGCNLIKVLGGTNYISLSILLTLGSNACSTVMKLLLTLDYLLIQSLVPTVLLGHLFFEITLTSGLSFKGNII